MDRIITIFKKDEWAFEKLRGKWYFINPFCPRFRITDKTIISKLEAVKRDNVYDDNDVFVETLSLIVRERAAIK